MTNKRERILLVAFIAVLVIVGGAILAKNLSRRLAGERALLADKKQELQETVRWIGDKNYWLSRQEWMVLHPPPPYLGQQSESTFVQTIQASLAKAGITTLEQSLQEVQPGSQFVKVTLDLRLESTLEQLVRWLYDTQRSTDYRVVSQIKLKSDEKGLKIQTEMSLVQLFDRPQP